MAAALLLGAAALVLSCSGDAIAPAAAPSPADVSSDTGGRVLPTDAGHEPADSPDDAHSQPDVVADFDQPCTSNEDCASGWCVQGPTGFVCTQPCIDECPFGFLCKSAAATGTDIIFLCVPFVQRLCEPCLSDDQCYGGTCESIGAAEGDGLTYCTAPCGEGGACPEGFSCIAGDSAAGARCWPDTGTCSCSEETAGSKRTCAVENAHGSCAGWETCDPVKGWTDCNAAEPESELCDGGDNDCNGLIDDGLSATEGCEATNEHGTCLGEAHCLGTLGWVCGAAEPAPEACDFADNDCDGVTDDPFVDTEGVYTTTDHCGTCGNACAGKYPFALETVCSTDGPSPLCKVDACAPGYFKLSDFQCIVPPNAACKPCADDADCYGSECIEVLGSDVCSPKCGSDADCEGELTCQEGHCLPANGSCDCDESTHGAKKSCSETNPIGTCFGLQTCDAAAGWSPCDASTPDSESCDGLDNDCNGAIDDGLDAPKCTLQQGVCSGATRQCGGGAGWLPCGTANLPATFEPVELTCDTLDNDCDGDADEGLKGPPCALSLGVCAGVVNVCVGGTLTGCDYGAAYQEKETLCDGLDNDCDGLVDNVDIDEDGFVAVACGGSDCDDLLSGVNPGVAESCDTPADDDCSGTAQDKDLDYDGFTDPACGGNDCDDANPLVHGSAVEVCGDGLDNDCSGLVDDKDTDKDGFVDLACGGKDCDDLNPLAWPGAPEVCGDGADNDCNGVVEDKDLDLDEHIDVACGGDDCNDGAAASHPGLDEVCGDGLDNDCDGSIDNKDLDGDSFGDPACGGTDCDDEDKTVHPGGTEACDTKDNDCNGLVDDKDIDNDGHLDIACPDGDDCDDNNVLVNPGAAEVCGDPDGVDEDCSGLDGDKDSDADGFVDQNPACVVPAALKPGDCNDDHPLIFPGAEEVYDTFDSDCDGTVDEDLVEPGAVVVSEFMADPKSVGDGFGEWIEVTNLGILPVNLASWTISDENAPTKDAFTLPVTDPVVVAPGGTAVLCRNSNPLLNGGVVCDAGYDDIILAQGGDEIILSLAGVEIDRVEYGLPGWTAVAAGASFSLDPNQLSKAGNDLPGNWCYTPTAFKLPGGDRGTPGTVNPSCTGAPAVTSVFPGHGVDNGGEAISVTGSGFIGVDTVLIGKAPCDGFEVLDTNTIACTTPPGTAGDADVVVKKGGETATLKAGYRYTGEAVKTIDWCAVMWPEALNAETGNPSPLVFAQTHSPGVTTPAGAPAGIIGELGYGPVGSDPRNEPGWTWQAGVWHKQFFANDEFKATMTVGVSGDYAYGWRFSDDGGTNYMYCDFDPGTADGFQVGTLPLLSVDY